MQVSASLLNTSLFLANKSLILKSLKVFPSARSTHILAACQRCWLPLGRIVLTN